MKRFLALTLTLCFAFGSSFAQAPLTSDQVDRFLNTLVKLNELPEINDPTVADPSHMTPEELQEKMHSPFTSSLEEMRGVDQFHAGLAIIKGEGFGDEVEWAGIGDRVMRAFAALKMSEVETAPDVEMAKAMAELEKAELPPELKQKMRDAMQVAKGMTEEVQKVPAGDIEAIRPHADRFETIASDNRPE